MPSPTPTTIRSHIAYFVIENLRSFIFIITLLVIALILGTVINGKKTLREAELAAASNTAPLAINVVTLQLQPTTILDKINLPGAVEPWTRLNLMAKVGGTIEEIFVTEGDHVEEGQLIARIETADYRIAFDSAKAAYKLAKADYSRDKELHRKGMSPKASLDAQETSLQIAKATLENAELQLSRCQILAPMAGVISKLDGEIGLLLNNGDPIAEILEIKRVKAVIGIPESDVVALKKLTSVEVAIQALGNKKIIAPIHFIAPSPESFARVYRLELELENEDGQILPGMFTRANIIKNINNQALVVPIYSVISRNDEHFIYTEEDNKAVKKNVTLGITEGWQVEITSGLSAGDKIIVEGHRSVETDQRVKIIKSITSIGELMP